MCSCSTRTDGARLAGEEPVLRVDAEEARVLRDGDALKALALEAQRLGGPEAGLVDGLVGDAGDLLEQCLLLGRIGLEAGLGEQLVDVAVAEVGVEPDGRRGLLAVVVALLVEGADALVAAL